ncbi:MAG: phosphotransferase [Acidimicrobiia bacterium]|nr:phosphotransferase [Acidimicrobiia bacterium]
MTMHQNEIPVDETLVQRLLANQFPEWSGLPLVRVLESGTDHALFRLGDALVVRLPIIDWADGQARLEATWLPRLASYVPVALSIPVALGAPADDYPFTWSVNPWLPGTPPTAEEMDDRRLAGELAGFVRALQGCDATGASLFGSRGGSLANPDRDEATRDSLRRCSDLVDADAALGVWEDAQAAPPWDGPATWFHGDLQRGNLLIQDGHLTGILDWGTFGAGDPAVELAVCWNSMGREARTVFRDVFAPDEATWRRGRGWAVSIAAMEIPYYRDSVPAFRDRSVRAIERVLAGEWRQR